MGWGACGMVCEWENREGELGGAALLGLEGDEVP